MARSLYEAAREAQRRLEGLPLLDDRHEPRDHSFQRADPSSRPFHSRRRKPRSNQAINIPGFSPDALTDARRHASRRTAGRRIVEWLLAGALLVAAGTSASAQVVADPFEGQTIREIQLRIDNPPTAPGERRALEDRLRVTFNVFPGAAYQSLQLDWGISRLRALPSVAYAQVEPLPSSKGGVSLVLRVRTREADQPPAPRRFPFLIQRGDALLKLKVMASGMFYANHNAWYGQPDAFVGSNTLADSPSGAGWGPWVEGAAELGIQGIGPITSSVYAYGSLSYLVSGSAGSELFTNKTRTHGAFEDAYAGVVFGRTWESGSRLVANVSVGRKAFQIADGMLIRLASFNGFDRGALQLNPRIAADNLYLAQARYNNASLEVFQLDPDELPTIDSRTIMNGVNIRTGLGGTQQVGLTYLHVPRSDYGYYTTTAVGTRAGLNVLDARFDWLPTLTGAPGLFAKTELAFQWNNANSFPMRAWGGYVEGGWAFSRAGWSPAVSYRLSAFTGDDPSTPTYERWDPLLSGGTPQEWVQGMNHYKMFQGTNLIAHRFQAVLSPSRPTQVVPQFWLFFAPSTNNLGGALSQLAGGPLGMEANVTMKYFPSRRVYLQAAMAYTWPESGVIGAIPEALHPWFSFMAMARITY